MYMRTGETRQLPQCRFKYYCFTHMENRGHSKQTWRNNYNQVFIIIIINVITLTIAKFSIVIGPPRAYLLRNWREVTLVST